MLDPTDLAYIAGLVDGEGCLRHDGYTERVSITSCYPHHLQWIKQTSGLGSVRKMPTKRAGHRCAYRLDICGMDAVEFVECIRPYLREKAYQADILLAIRKLPRGSEARKVALVELTKAKRIEYGPE